MTTAAASSTSPESVDGALDLITSKLEQWYEALVGLVPNLAVALVVIVLFWLLSRLVRGLIRRLMSKVSSNQAVNNLASTVIALIVLLIGLFIGLEIMQLDKAVTSLLAGAGVIGLALGFAFQDIAANFMSGFFISVRNPFSVGDIIETNDIFGTVQTINLRSTVIRTTTGQRVIIPNKDIFENAIVNFSASGERRVDLACGVSYADDLETARRVAIEAIEGLPHRIEGRDAELFFDEFGGSSINFKLRFWIDETAQRGYLAAQSEAIIRLKKAFAEHDISIPFPIRTLDFGVEGGETLTAALRGVPLGGTGDDTDGDSSPAERTATNDGGDA